VTTPPAPTPRRGRQSARPPARPAHDEPAAAPRRVTFGTVAWLVILALIVVVRLSRQAWPDVALLLVVLAVLLADLAGRLPHGTLDVAATGPGVIGAAVLAGVVLVLAPRFGGVAGVAVVAVGVGTVAYAWPDRPPDDSAAEDLTTWNERTTHTATAWAAAWIAGCLWELAMFLLGGRTPDAGEEYPAVTDLVNPVVDNSAGKALFVVVWLAAGVWLLGRVDRR
jgi:hypothetical protein